MANLLKGKVVSDQIIDNCIKRIDILKQNSITPTLALFRVGEKDSDISYEKGILKRCEQVGIEVKQYLFKEDVDPNDFYDQLKIVNNDNSIHGILVFRPLPSSFNDDELRNAIHPSKDIDGCSDISLGSLFLNKDNGFSPCTAEAVIKILHYYNIEIERKNVVVLGRSLVIGKPVSMLLLNENATITICHSKTENLKEICKKADIIIAAIGKMESINSEYISNNQTIIDVGIHFNELKQKLCGDVLFEDVFDHVLNITPVPLGVGSVTTSILIEHVIRACEKQTKNTF